ncbi:hypothetical protein KZZ52_02500 [Dactylosporangium sp. AC04546]|uniref:hypothetical protein n=1 Tax=Dactylosporangium sp. AC04546 TaxID=2862460 RepID=UPI001EDEACA6|nr:hypothetical protein [Dactylosporangium sp. AC04546]WVK84325.1 hypothetical protein KZZ52_02500 [Dactylosporangium sp. AC04546]
MDRTGRRRRLFTVLGAGLGVLVIAGGALLIAGLLGSSPVPLPGLPERGQGGRAGLSGVQQPDSGTPTRPPAVVRTTTQPPKGTTPTTAATTDLPGNRKTSHPGNANPKPSRSR